MKLQRLAVGLTQLICCNCHACALAGSRHSGDQPQKQGLLSSLRNTPLCIHLPEVINSECCDLVAHEVCALQTAHMHALRTDRQAERWRCACCLQAMDPHAADCQTAMYCNRYPSVEGKHFPEGALRIGAHTDFELLTLLFTRPGQPLPLPCRHPMPACLKAPVSHAICYHMMF